MIILSFANSNCAAFNLSEPSTAALMAATFTRFAKSVANIVNKLGPTSKNNHDKFLKEM
ncbi:hypothetical protein HanRHA438_Chr13g0585681 [Helianthus annuus]|nr:hypothetical protein HanRHA438_Chr13g0585681 [Helianthus annuus]